MAKINLPLQTEIKIFSIASSVTRLYAIYEFYVETILSDYLDLIADLIEYKDLSDGLKIEYRLGISHILSRIDQGRYKHLNHESVVNSYHAALSGGQPYQFVTDALVRHEQNLRLNILSNLFSRLGLDDFESWASKHLLMVEYFELDIVPMESIENQIKDMVDLRNDASHGEIDNLVNVEIMKSNCNFVIKFLEVIRQFISTKLITKMYSQGQIVKLGKVTESFGKNGAFILTAEKGASITKSDLVFIIESNKYSSQTIESIQLNGINLDTFKITNDASEIGLKCPLLVKNNAVLYKEI